jgi:D-ribose pyranase
MKKIGILNQPLSTVIAGMGHLDALVVADAGLPIPPETRRVDLALTEGLPPFLDTLRVILGELQVERAILAEEFATASPGLFQDVLQLLGAIPYEAVPHTAFKERTRTAHAVVRTGEFTPYANIILIAGVVF